MTVRQITDNYTDPGLCLTARLNTSRIKHEAKLIRCILRITNDVTIVFFKHFEQQLQLFWSFALDQTCIGV